MADRHDALAAAAEIVLALEAAARVQARRDPATVATVGRLDVEPGAISVIPARVRAALEVRGIDAGGRRRRGRPRRRGAGVAERRGVTVTRRLLRGGDPIALDPALADRAFAAAERRGLPRPHVLGAGHDAGHIAAHVPAGLLFVPLAGGQSHTPREAADDANVLAAGRVLVDVLGGN